MPWKTNSHQPFTLSQKHKGQFQQPGRHCLEEAHAKCADIFWFPNWTPRFQGPRPVQPQIISLTPCFIPSLKETSLYVTTERLCRLSDLKILVSSGLRGLLLHSDWQKQTNPLWKWRSACSNSVRWKRASAFARVIPMWSAWNLKCETNKKPFKFAWNCFFLTKAHLRTTWASSNDLVHRVSRP